MFNKKLYNLFLLLIFTTSISCQQNNLPEDLNITVDELKEEMISDTNLVILDVRKPKELTGTLGQIEGVINIPVQVLEERIEELSEYKNRNIAVICRSGNRSVAATIILNSKGFSAKNVLGGMIAYNK